MNVATAIISGLRKSFTFSGRATRPEFWWFFPISGSFPILTYLALKNSALAAASIPFLLVVMLSSLPFLSSGSRRLRDAGEDNSQVLAPLAPPLMMYIAWSLFRYVGTGTLYFSFLTGQPFLILFASWILIIIFLLLLIPAFFIAIIASLITTANVFGLFLLPSTQTVNKYGPTPDEAAI